MPLLPVVVDIAADDARPELGAALIAACTDAVPETDCVAAADRRDPQPASAVAIVTWLGDRRVRIQVGIRQRQEWRVRVLDFAEDDAPIERWKAAGFATGTLAGRVTHEDRRAAGEQPAPPAPLAEPAAQPAPPSAGPLPSASAPPRSERDALAYWFDASLVAGPGLSPASGRVAGPWRIGGVARFAVAPAPRWPFGVVSFGYAAASEDDAGVGAGFMLASAGVGFRLLGSTCEACLDLRAEALATYVGVQADDPATGLTDEQSRWVGGLRLGLDAGWMATATFGPFVGFELDWAGAKTEVRLQDSDHAHLPRPGVTGLIGVRLRPR